MARLKDLYKAEVAPALLKKYNYKSVMQIPKLDKSVINVGVGDAKDNSKRFCATFRSFPVRRQSQPAQRSLSQTSRSVRA